MEGARDLLGVDLAQARRQLEPSLFDAAFYRGQAGLKRDDDGFAHYVAEGAKSGLKPNVVFEPRWYVDRNPDAAGFDPLLHYALIGEPAGRNPSPLFDVDWYRRTYAAERPLAHYLAHRFGPFSPIPEFDAAYYLKAYPDVGAARVDPFLHYMRFGFREFRKPRAGFNPRLYANRYLSGDRAANPLAHMRENPEAAPAAPRPGPYDAVKTYARRGPRFEARALPPPGVEPRALVLAFHLTQFHRVAENDSWWGEGFTEWTHLGRGQPRFAGHYQPRIPGELGFYDLARPDALRAQTEMAKAAGVGGFVFYYYDFDGRRLLEKPLEMFLAAPNFDIGFCLMWANENWTRRWDGAEDDALLVQTYSEASEAPRVADFARHFRDPRYIRLGGRPLLMVYRASLIPDAAPTLARWRRLFAEAHGEHPVFVMAQTFDDVDPRALGFDGAIEFPPHKLTKGLPQVYDSLEIYDEAFEADAFAYGDLVEASLSEAAPEFPLIKTAVPSWDNDARRQGQGLTIVGSTPRQYELWLGALIDAARPFFGTRIVAVNAWNEWSEGAYLEPDVHFGAAYLNATARAAFGLAPEKTKFVASPQQSELARRLAAAFGVGVGVADVETAATGLAEAGDAITSEERLRDLFSQLWPQMAKVSVFVVHRGDGPFDPLRLRSVFAQTYPVWELVVLDEGEASLDVVDAEARAVDRDVSLGLGVVDPWPRAAEMASGDFVWIVESDGRSDPTCLAALATPLRGDPGAAFVFCDSRPADAEGRPVHARPNPLAPPERLASFADRTFAGPEFLARLAAGTTPNASAILWRRDALRLALAAGENAAGESRDAPQRGGGRGGSARPSCRGRFELHPRADLALHAECLIFE